MNDIKREFGGFNDFPLGWREIPPDEFGRKMNYQSFVSFEYRQMHSEDNSTVIMATLFFFPDKTGIAVSKEWLGIEQNYKQISKFYAFGCSHVFHEIDWNREEFGTQYKGLHAVECINCGIIETIDSSD